MGQEQEGNQRLLFRQLDQQSKGTYLIALLHIILEQEQQEAPLGLVMTNIFPETSHHIAGLGILLTLDSKITSLMQEAKPCHILAMQYIQNDTKKLHRDIATC